MASVVSSKLVQRFRVRELPHLFSSPQPKPKPVANPFLPKLNEKTGKWAPPRYSIRRQAELVKEAKRSGEIYLLPPGLKNLPKPTEVVAKHPKPSPLLQLIQSAKSEGTSTPASEKVDSEAVQWVGEPQQRTTFGLYGKRQKMFKGRKWEKQVKLRKAYVKKVVAGLDAQKRNMRWGRQRRAKRPRSKYPI